MVSNIAGPGFYSTMAEHAIENYQTYYETAEECESGEPFSDGGAFYGSNTACNRFVFQKRYRENILLPFHYTTPRSFNHSRIEKPRREKIRSENAPAG